MLKGIIIAALSAVPAAALASADSLSLHYDSPAQYFEQALPIGNGRIGAMVYGGVKTDRLTLNDITLWTGEPDTAALFPDAHKALPEIRAMLEREDYKAANKANRQLQGHYSADYQPLGTLTIDYHDRATAKAKGYRRGLDLSRAVAWTSYDGFQAQYFASSPDSCITIVLHSDSQPIDADLRFTSPLPHQAIADGTTITARGYTAYKSYPGYYGGVADECRFLYDPDRGTHFTTTITAERTGAGTVAATPTGEIAIRGCRDVVIVVRNATSFDGNRGNEGKIVRAPGAPCSMHSGDLLRRHIADYQSLFGRLQLDLGRTDPAICALPTDRRLLAYTDSAARDPELETLYFQYGRYLLIASSRTPGVPANLQGLWNESMTPPWSGNYTSNINLQENYWAACAAALPEMEMPLLGFIDRLRASGRQTAKAYYNVQEGWCLGQNTDIWAMTNPVGMRTGNPVWACWNMGGAWLATHIWEHYLFTRDKATLRQYWPALKEAAQFCLGILIEKDGHLITSPSTSPENEYKMPDGYCGSTLYGATADIAIIRECLTDALLAAKAVGDGDKAFAKRAKATLARLLPYKVGKEGRLQEWYHDWADRDPHHRHQSHLFGLYPGHQITPKTTPALAKACAATLRQKGFETTGWSCGWRVNLYARLGDADGAYKMLRRLLRYVSPDKYTGQDARRGGGTYPNLFDAHSPFQIDGNFGGMAGIIEIIGQGLAPKVWQHGYIKGMRTREGKSVDIEW